MNFTRVPHPVPDPMSRTRLHVRPHVKRWSATAFAMAVIAAQVGHAHAAITNNATAKGTAPGGPVDGITGSDNESVTVAPADAQLVVTKTAGAFVDTVVDGIIKGGDTIQFTINIANTGNTTMYNVAPLETGAGNGATFNGTAGTGSFGSYSPATATIAPGANQNYTVTYTLSNADAFRAAGITNAVDNTASAEGNIGSSGGTAITSADVTPGTEETTLPSNPEVTITKNFTLTKTLPNAVAGQAQVGDIINYSYIVVNSGNRTLSNVIVDDVHEGTLLPNAPPPRTVRNETLTSDGPLANSVDEAVAVNNGTWVTMGAGATVTYTYAHTVTQAEFNNQ